MEREAGSTEESEGEEDGVNGEKEEEINVKTEENVEGKREEVKKPEADTQPRPKDSKGTKDKVKDRPGLPSMEDVPELGQDTHSDAATRSPSPRSPRGGSPSPAPQREPSGSLARERRNRKRRQKVRTYPSEDEEAQGHQGFSMEGALPQGRHQMSITKDVPQQLAQRPRSQQQQQPLQGPVQPAPLAPPQQQQETKKDPMRLRLDLNLDIEVTLKARIHGDLELALLVNGVPRYRDIDVDVHLDCSISDYDDVYDDLGLGKDVPLMKPVIRRRFETTIPVKLPCRVAFKDVEFTKWEDIDFEVTPL
ncbi:hypothetical protein EV426DRAFT_139853 [Tirmania nivea]|nr:hypothetical protein EV426DRAFT_139853 [Tirmania nivea]